MPFHLGKPILAMVFLSLLSGGFIAFRSPPKRAELTIWTFADSHYKSYKTFQDRNPDIGKTYEVVLGQARAVCLRMESCFMSGSGASEMPDLAEVEISFIGRFFRPPVNEVGFLPLNDRLKKSGLYDQIVKTRFAPWSKQGVIFGVPHDLHPTTISYRDDLFREAGIDLSTANTWPRFHELCLQFEKYWRSRGYYQRHAIELSLADTSHLVTMLLQRGVNVVDDYDRVHLADPKVANTLAFYAQMVAGSRQVAAESPSSTGMAAWGKDFTEGNICSCLTPDWRATYLKAYAPKLSGKMRMMPLPVFDSTDSPTSTWGGTMMGIPRTCKNPDAAWDLLCHLYFSKEGIEARRENTDILPPIRTMWADPYYHRADPFFGGQQVYEMYIQLADRLPPRYVTPATTVATASLAYVLHLAVSQADVPDLEARCQGWLNLAAADLERRMAQWQFDASSSSPPEAAPAAH